MSTPGAVAPRLDDASAFRKALWIVRSKAGASVAFGGPTRDGALVLDQVLGDQTRKLRGLRVLPGRGLGGQVVATERLLSVDDYGASTLITHHYDDEVLAEGLRGLTAVPVLVRGNVRGALYAGARVPGRLGGVATSLLIDVAKALSNELAIRDEVNRRLHLLENGPPPPAPTYAGLEELHAELCGIAAGVDDPEVRRRLQAAAGRLAFLGTPEATAAPHGVAVPSLTPRELDVLAEVELGCTNAEVASRLSLLPETVKAYLRSASRKLGVHGRYQAVLTARRLGLLAGR